MNRKNIYWTIPTIIIYGYLLLILGLENPLEKIPYCNVITFILLYASFFLLAYGLSQYAKWGLLLLESFINMFSSIKKWNLIIFFISIAYIIFFLSFYSDKIINSEIIRNKYYIIVNGIRSEISEIEYFQIKKSFLLLIHGITLVVYSLGLLILNKKKS